jgi:hypothetical protein
VAGLVATRFNKASSFFGPLPLHGLPGGEMFEGFAQELKRPTNLISLAATMMVILIGAAVSLHFYLLSVRAGEFAFQVQQIPIFDQSNLPGAPSAPFRAGSNLNVPGSPFTVVDVGGHRVTENIYGAKIRVWNAGNDQIRAADTRIPFSIHVGDGRVIYAALSRATQDNVDRFSLTANLELNWQNFDPHEGFEAAVVYTAKAQQVITLTGFAVNTAGPIDVDRERDDRTIFHNTVMDYATAALLPLQLLIVGSAILGNRNSARAAKVSKVTLRLSITAMIIVGVVLVITATVHVFSSKVAAPF